MFKQKRPISLFQELTKGQWSARSGLRATRRDGVLDQLIWQSNETWMK